MRYDDEYEFEHGDVANDADDLFNEYDDYEYEEDEIDEQSEWENYYHNIADEIVDD